MLSYILQPHNDVYLIKKYDIRKPHQNALRIMSTTEPALEYSIDRLDCVDVQCTMIDDIVEDINLSNRFIDLLIENNYYFIDELFWHSSIFILGPIDINVDSYKKIFEYVFERKYNRFSMICLFQYKKLIKFIRKYPELFNKHIKYVIKSKCFGFSTKKYFLKKKNKVTQPCYAIYNLINTLDNLEMYDILDQLLSTGIIIKTFQFCCYIMRFSKKLISLCEKYSTHIDIKHFIFEYNTNVPLMQYMEKIIPGLFHKKYLENLFLDAAMDHIFDITELKKYLDVLGIKYNIDIVSMVKNILRKNEFNFPDTIQLVSELYPEIFDTEFVTEMIKMNLFKDSVNNRSLNKLFTYDFNKDVVFQTLFHPNVFSSFTKSKMEDIVSVFAQNNLLDPIFMHRLPEDIVTNNRKIIKKLI